MEHLEVHTSTVGEGIVEDTSIVAEAESGSLSDGMVEENRGKILPKCSAVAKDLVEAKSLRLLMMRTADTGKVWRKPQKMD